MNSAQQYGLTTQFVTQLKAGLETLTRYQLCQLHTSGNKLIAFTASPVPDYMKEYLKKINWVQAHPELDKFYYFDFDYEQESSGDLMFYTIKKQGKYFNSGSSHWVSSTGHCETPTWGEREQAWVTSSKDLAEEVAKLYGGAIEEFDHG